MYPILELSRLFLERLSSLTEAVERRRNLHMRVAVRRLLDRQRAPQQRLTLRLRWVYYQRARLRVVVRYCLCHDLKHFSRRPAGPCSSIRCRRLRL